MFSWLGRKQKEAEAAASEAVGTATAVITPAPDAHAPTAPANPAAGSTAPGDTAPGSTAPGDTAPGDTAPGDTAPRDTAPGNTAPGSAPDAPWAAAAATAPDAEAGARAGIDMNLDALLAPPPPSATSGQPQIGPTDEARTDALKPSVVDAISTVFDPEIPVNIYELGLIYEIAADAESRVGVKMTLTSPACPSAQQIPSEVRYKVKALEGVTDCHVEIVWEPPWTKDMMSETAKLSLGMF